MSTKKILQRLAFGALGLAAAAFMPVLAQDGPMPDDAIPPASAANASGLVEEDQGPISLPAAPARSGAAALTKADVDAWLDGFLPYAIREADLAGAQVVVVKDGEILTARGFGYADLAARTPVDGAKTMFRPGSISKLFTWIAVMQLVEEGRVDLDTDVNTYIDITIPEAFDAPITLRHLLTHTPGFQERFKNLIIGDPELALPLEDFMKEAAPPERIFPPGETPGYSNYGTALAGYVVQKVSGVPFERYVDEEIFAPIGMTEATFEQPLPEAFEPMMSEGYRSASDGEPQYYELVPMSPAGSMAASGEAMGRFMIALLERDPRLLSPETWEQTFETIYQLTPPLNAMALGFWELDKGALRIRGHGGDTSFFHSDLNVMIDENAGIYVVVNSTGEGAGALRFAVTAGFAERYFPEASIPVGDRLPTAVEHARMVVGQYESTRTVKTNFAAILRLLGQSTITMTEEGDLVFPLFGPPLVWREVEPFVWRHVDGYERLAAVVEEGEVQYVTFEPVSPIMHLTPAPWYRSSGLVLPVLAMALGLLAITLLAWPIRAIVRWRYWQPFPLSGREALAYRTVRVGIVLVFTFLFAWFLTFQTLFSDLSGLGGQFEVQLFLTMASQILLYAGFAAALFNAAVVVSGGGSWFAKGWSVVIPFLILLVILFAATNGLLSWQTNF